MRIGGCVTLGLLHQLDGLARFALLKLSMPRSSPYKHHRFPHDIIICAVRWYLQFLLSYQDVVKLLAEREINHNYDPSAKATLSGIETIRTIKRGHIRKRLPGICGEIQFISQLFETT